MKRKTKTPPSKPLAETINSLLRTGKLTPEGLAEAQIELDEDPEWQAFLAAQPKKEAA
ncbi:MAG: hypothetical protein H7330_02825 [Hymenobacteraceae bacterium]|nr:hypothetical protein [Hymenobacteraceae bacterium]